MTNTNKQGETMDDQTETAPRTVALDAHLETQNALRAALIERDQLQKEHVDVMEYLDQLATKADEVRELVGRANPGAWMEPPTHTVRKSTQADIEHEIDMVSWATVLGGDFLRGDAQGFEIRIYAEYGFSRRWQVMKNGAEVHCGVSRNQHEAKIAAMLHAMIGGVP